MLKGLITSIFPPKRFARWSSCTLDGTCFDLSLHVDERERLALWRQRHDRCTLRSGSLSFTSRGLINQKEALLPPSLSLSPRHSRLPLPRRCVFVHHRALSSPPSSFGLHLHLALSLFLSYMYICVCIYIYIYLAHPLRDKSRKGVVGRPSHRVSAFLSRPCREKPLAPDAAYAENIAEVATHCPGVAVECSFADDGVISSYYTLWHRRGRPMKPKRMIPPLLPLSSSTPRCLASSSRALLFQSNYDFAISFPDHPLRLVDVVFRVPIVKLSLSLSSSSFSTRFLFIPFEISATESLLKWRGGNLFVERSSSALLHRECGQKKRGQKYTLDEARGYIFSTGNLRLENSRIILDYY